MHVKILRTRKIAASEVRKGDYLIDPRQPNGFGLVDIVGSQAAPSTTGVTLVIGKEATPYDAATEVEVAVAVLEEDQYGRRVVEQDTAVFRTPVVLYQGDVG